jgi:hypothetical protein
MRCEDCNIKLQITHTYAAGDVAKTSTAKCPQCGKKYTAITILISSEKGAAAWAKRLKKTCLSMKSKVLSILDSNEISDKE